MLHWITCEKYFCSLPQSDMFKSWSLVNSQHVFLFCLFELNHPHISLPLCLSCPQCIFLAALRLLCNLRTWREATAGRGCCSVRLWQLPLMPPAPSHKYHAFHFSPWQRRRLPKWHLKEKESHYLQKQTTLELMLILCALCSSDLHLWFSDCRQRARVLRLNPNTTISRVNQKPPPTPTPPKKTARGLREKWIDLFNNSN